MTQTPLQLVQPDADRARRLHAARHSLRYFVENYRELQGEYPGWTVVLCDARIVSADLDPAKAMDGAREKGHDPSDCIVQLVPAPGQSYFF